MKKKDIETLFWFNFAWAMLIFNNTDNVSFVIHLDKIKLIADKIKEINPSYFYGAVYSIYVAYYGGRAPELGGNYKLCDEYYQKGKSYTKGNSLINDYVYFRFVLPQRSQKSKFEQMYKQIMEFDLNQNPSNVFINKVIQEKTIELYQKKDNFFKKQPIFPLI